MWFVDLEPYKKLTFPELHDQRKRVHEEKDTLRSAKKRLERKPRPIAVVAPFQHAPQPAPFPSQGMPSNQQLAFEMGLLWILAILISDW